MASNPSASDSVSSTSTPASDTATTPTGTQSLSSIASLSIESNLSISSTASVASTTTASPSVSTVFHTVTQISSNGKSTFTTIFETPSTVPTVQNDTSSSNTNIGAIVGGTVGGVVALSALLLLLWFWRRRQKKNEFFDDMFDPDRTLERPTNMAQADLDLGGADAAARPYSYSSPSTHGALMSEAGSHSVSAPTQWSAGSEAGFLGAGAAGIGAGAGAAYAAGAGRRSGDGSAYYEHPANLQPGGVAHHGQPYPPSAYGGSSSGGRPLSGHETDLTSEGSVAGGGISPYGVAQAQAPPPQPIFRSNKEREAYMARQGRQQSLSSHTFSVVNPTSPSTESPAPSQVMVHQDGGRVPEQPEAENEIPPTYDSIPRS